MDKLGKNKFITMMVVLFVVAVVAFGILVIPTWTDSGNKSTAISKRADKIKQELAALPADDNVKAWADVQAALKKRYAMTLEDLQKRDRNLSQWFEGIDDHSTFAAFQTPYDDLRGKLEDELLEKGVLLGSPQDRDGKIVETRSPGFNWIQRTDIARADTTEKEMQAKEILQKRFNICRAIVNAVTANLEKSPRQRRLLDVTFLEKFPFLAMSTVTPDNKLLLIPVDYRRYTGFTMTGMTELALPSNGDEPLPVADGEAKPADAAPAPVVKTDKKSLGKTITFGFAVVMEYQHVPEMLRHLLQPTVEPELNLSVLGLSVFVPEPNFPEKVETKMIPAGPEGDKEVEELRKKEAELTAASQPPLVHVYVTCQVLDLDPSAVPAFLK